VVLFAMVAPIIFAKKIMMKYLFIAMVWLCMACQTLEPATPEVMQEATPDAEALSKDSAVLAAYINHLTLLFDSIPADRKKILTSLSHFIQEQRDSSKQVNLTFICTHNSRRSHMAQIWATTAAAHFGIGQIVCYSGGTEATAFNPRAVAALQRAGFGITPTDTTTPNIRYAVAIPTGQPLVCFSKKYDSYTNPQTNFAAVMTCSQADEACPNIPGAMFRVAIPYDDPKQADNTPAEANRYDERCRQIGTEMMYVFSLLKQK
jgi:hypothetical protein